MEEERGPRAWGEVRSKALQHLRRERKVFRGPLRDLLAKMNPRPSSQASFVFGDHGDCSPCGCPSMDMDSGTQYVPFLVGHIEQTQKAVA